MYEWEFAKTSWYHRDKGGFESDFTVIYSSRDKSGRRNDVSTIVFGPYLMLECAEENH